MRKITVVFVVVFLSSVFAVGQDTEKGSVFGGYQYMSVGTQGFSRQNTNGWDADLAVNVKKNFALVADVSGAYQGNFLAFSGLTAHIYNVLFGPRIVIPVGKAQPFAEANFGFDRVGLSRNGINTTNTSFAMAVGGGLDINASQHFGIRLFKIDYLLDRAPLNRLGITNNLNNIRLATGVKFRF
jgi:hypothetical protein